MADVSSGPVSTLPGARSVPPATVACDHHGCLSDATVRVQGETDSFGAEYLDFCARHIPKREELVGRCDWCKTENVELRSVRDPEEGMAGPVYEVCEPCRKKQNEALEAELEEHYRTSGDDYAD